jgi:hypothetical protein
MPNETSPTEPFAASRILAEDLFAWVGSNEAVGLEHSDLESRLDELGRQLLRQMFADQMDLRALRETRIAVVAARARLTGPLRLGIAAGCRRSSARSA